MEKNNPLSLNLTIPLKLIETTHIHMHTCILYVDL